MSMKIYRNMSAQQIMEQLPFPLPLKAKAFEAKEIALKKALSASTATIIDSFGTNKVLKLQGLYAKHAALPVDSPARKAAEKEIQKFLKTLNKS